MLCIIKSQALSTPFSDAASVRLLKRSIIRNRPYLPFACLEETFVLFHHITPVPDVAFKTVSGIPRLLAPLARLRTTVGVGMCCVRCTASSSFV